MTYIIYEIKEDADGCCQIENVIISFWIYKSKIKMETMQLQLNLKNILWYRKNIDL